MPLLKCVEGHEVEYVLTEIHEVIYGQHLRGRSLATEALRASYYLSTINEDANNYVKKYDKCQRHTDVHITLGLPGCLLGGGQTS